MRVGWPVSVRRRWNPDFVFAVNCDAQLVVRIGGGKAHHRALIRREGARPSVDEANIADPDGSPRVTEDRRSGTRGHQFSRLSAEMFRFGALECIGLCDMVSVSFGGVRGGAAHDDVQRDEHSDRRRNGCGGLDYLKP